jgi:hypothetical protein
LILWVREIHPLKLLKYPLPESQAHLDFSALDRIKLRIGP